MIKVSSIILCFAFNAAIAQSNATQQETVDWLNSKISAYNLGRGRFGFDCSGRETIDDHTVSSVQGGIAGRYSYYTHYESNWDIFNYSGRMNGRATSDNTFCECSDFSFRNFHTEFKDCKIIFSVDYSDCYISNEQPTQHTTKVYKTLDLANVSDVSFSTNDIVISTKSGGDFTVPFNTTKEDDIGNRMKKAIFYLRDNFCIIARNPNEKF